MHQCLQISEIQDCIIRYIPRQTIFQLVLTCRAFYDPAMDIIWAAVVGYAPLIKCMPADVWTQNTVSDYDGTVVHLVSLW